MEGQGTGGWVKGLPFPPEYWFSTLYAGTMLVAHGKYCCVIRNSAFSPWELAHTINHWGKDPNPNYWSAGFPTPSFKFSTINAKIPSKNVILFHGAVIPKVWLRLFPWMLQLWVNQPVPAIARGGGKTRQFWIWKKCIWWLALGEGQKVLLRIRMQAALSTYTELLWHKNE